MMPMITMTTSTSRSVNPEVPRRAISRRRKGLFDVPAADVGIGAVTAGLAIGAQRVQVIVAVRARRDVRVVVAPWILAQVVDVAAFLPVLDVRIGRPLHE